MNVLKIDSDVGDEFEVEEMLQAGEEYFSKCDLTGYFEVSGSNVNWRGSGFDDVVKRIKSFDDLLQKFSTYGSYNAEIKFYPQKHYIVCRISHHDCPCGSFFYFDAVRKKRYEKLLEEGEI